MGFDTDNAPAVTAAPEPAPAEVSTPAKPARIRDPAKLAEAARKRHVRNLSERVRKAAAGGDPEALRTLEQLAEKTQAAKKAKGKAVVGEVLPPEPAAQPVDAAKAKADAFRAAIEETAPEVHELWGGVGEALQGTRFALTEKKHAMLTRMTTPMCVAKAEALTPEKMFAAGIVLAFGGPALATAAEWVVGWWQRRKAAKAEAPKA